MNSVIEITIEWKNIFSLFVALGDEQRHLILLAFDKNERLNILQIVASSKLGRTAVTHHLKILHNSGALSSEKVGKGVFFWVNKAHITTEINNVLDYIKDHI